MKKSTLLSIAATLVCCAAIAQKPITISVDYNKKQPLQKLVYGTNNEFTNTSYNPNTEMYKDIFREVGLCSFRYPAGTPANYINLRTGFAEVWRGTNSNSSNRVLGFNEGIYASKPDRGVDYQDFIKFMKDVKPTCNFVMNVTSMSVDENREMLLDMRSQGVELTHIEMGNEVYFGAYMGAFPDVNVYLNKVEKYADMAREVFPGVKISLVVHLHYYTTEVFLESVNDSEDRMHQWYEGVKNAKFNDAISVHLYSSLGMKDSVTAEEFWPFLDSYHSAISHSDCRTDMTLDKVLRDFPDKECWVTEYHVGGFIGELRSYRLRHTYIGAVFSTDFMLKLFGHPNVTLSSWHCFNQWFGEPNDIAELMDKGAEAFHYKPNVAFLKMFKEPVNLTSSFVRVKMKGVESYSGTGKFKGEFDEVDAGLFFDEHSGLSYLVVINKMENTYKFDAKRLERAISAPVKEVVTITPDTSSQSLTDALGSEVDFIQKQVDVQDGGYVVEPYSITRFELKR